MHQVSAFATINKSARGRCKSYTVKSYIVKYCILLLLTNGIYQFDMLTITIASLFVIHRLTDKKYIFLSRFTELRFLWDTWNWNWKEWKIFQDYINDLSNYPVTSPSRNKIRWCSNYDRKAKDAFQHTFYFFI